MKSLRQHKSLIKFIVVSVVFSILLTLSLNLSAYAAPCPPTCNEMELITLAATNPQAAYNTNSELSVKVTSGKILDNHDIAHDYFTKHPEKMKEYRKFAQNYFMTKGKINSKLMKTYLSKDVTIHDEQDLWIARKYLQSNTFKDSTDRTIFKFYMRDVKAMTAQDKTIAKSFFTAENGKYINENTQNVRELFKKYLKAEGVEVVAINGPIKSFTRDGTLSGKNAKVNIYNLKEKAGFSYALKVESDGSLALSQTQFEIKKKEETVKKEKLKQEQMGTSKWDVVWSVLTGESGEEFFTKKSKEKMKEAPKTEISEEFVTTYEPGFYPTDVKVPFEGDLKIGEAGGLNLKEGSLSNVDVKGAEDVTVSSNGIRTIISGKFKEVAGVELEESSYLRIHKLTPPAAEGSKQKIALLPMIEGYAVDGNVPTIKRINAKKITGYNEFNEETGNAEYLLGDIYGHSNGIPLAGKFNIKDYDNINPQRHVLVPMWGDINPPLTLNDVTIYPTKRGYYTHIYFPNNPSKLEQKSERYVEFTKEGVVVSGADTNVIVKPSGIIKNELAATGKTKGLISFPSKGYFKVGDKDKEGESNIKKIQGFVGAPQTGVYDQATYEKVYGWQMNKQLDGKQPKVDGLFGKQTLQTYLQNTQGNIKIITLEDLHHARISFEEGKLKIKSFGNVNVDVGKKKYSFSIEPPMQELASQEITEVKAVSAEAPEEPHVKQNVELLAGFNPNPFNNDITLDYNIEKGNTAYPVDLLSYYDSYYKFLPYYQFDRKQIYQQTGNFIDTLINPELIKDGVEVNPQFKDLVKDGKLKVVYLAGRSNEGSKGVLDHDTNILLPETEPTIPEKKVFTKKFKTKEGEEINVEVITLWTQQQLEEELKKSEDNKDYVDYLQLSGHSESWSTQRVNLGEGRGYFSSKDLTGEKHKKIYHAPKLVGISSCVATKRVVPGIQQNLIDGQHSNFFAALHQSKKDIGTTILGGLLTGKSSKEINEIANAESKAPIFEFVGKGS